MGCDVAWIQTIQREKADILTVIVISYYSIVFINRFLKKYVGLFGVYVYSVSARTFRCTVSSGLHHLWRVEIQKLRTNRFQVCIYTYIHIYIYIHPRNLT